MGLRCPPGQAALDPRCQGSPHGRPSCAAYPETSSAEQSLKNLPVLMEEIRLEGTPPSPGSSACEACYKMIWSGTLTGPP